MIDAEALAKAVHEEARFWSEKSHFSDAPELTAAQRFERMMAETPLADETLLAQVIDETFWASLLAEEGRACRPRVTYVPGPDSAVHALGHPVVLHREVLRKLSPAQGRGVVWDARNGQPTIVGLHPRSRFRHQRGVTVSAVGPGALEFVWGDVRLVSFHGGKVLRLSTAKLGEVASVTEYVAREIGVIDVVFLLPALHRIQRESHGGSLWIIPADAPLDGITVQTPLVVDPRPLLERFPVGSDDTRIAWLESIAGLAAVDGAVLMDSKLRLLGFGAFVKLSETPVTVQKWMEGGGARLANSAEGWGGRHRAAAEFCHHFSPACAFVVSEDGGVSAFVASDNGLVQHHPVVSLGLAY